jgi:hypothetical protein
MVLNSDADQWERLEEHLDLLSDVRSYSLRQDSDVAYVTVREDTHIGRELFTRVADMGFIVAEMDGTELMLINILGKYSHYLPDEILT